MSMNVGSSNPNADPDVVVEMNTTPLIDVMLVLLIMLIVTIPIQTHAVKLDLPTGNPPPPTNPPPVVNVIVDFDDKITWNGADVASEADLVGQLTAIGKQPEEAQPEIHLEPNKLASYGAVAHVMADAQRLGVKRLGVVGGY
jgi:biopolymer transport protein ExbD